MPIRATKDWHRWDENHGVDSQNDPHGRHEFLANADRKLRSDRLRQSRLSDLVLKNRFYRNHRLLYIPSPDELIGIMGFFGYVEPDEDD